MYKIKQFSRHIKGKQQLLIEVEKFLNNLNEETTKVVSVSNAYHNDFFEILITYKER